MAGLTPAGRAGILLANARARARNHGFALDIDKVWVQVRLEAGICELTGIRFDLQPLGNGLQNPFSPSIDRINPEIGYTIGNSRVIVTAMNLALHSFGELVFEHIAQSYLRNISGNTQT